MADKNAWLHPGTIYFFLRALVPFPDLPFTQWSREHESLTFLRPIFRQRRWRFRRSRIDRYLTKPDQIARSYTDYRYALTAQCGLFRTVETKGGCIARGGASLRNVVGRHTDATQFIELYASYYVVTPSFSWSQYILKVDHIIQRLSSTVISCRDIQCFSSHCGNHVLVRFNPYLHATSMCWWFNHFVRYVGLSFDPAMRSMLADNRREPPPTAIDGCVNKVLLDLNIPSWFAPRKVRKGLEKIYFLTSDLLCFFTSVYLCQLVILLSLIVKQIFESLFP